MGSMIRGKDSRLSHRLTSTKTSDLARCFSIVRFAVGWGGCCVLCGAAVCSLCAAGQGDCTSLNARGSASCPMPMSQTPTGTAPALIWTMDQAMSLLPPPPTRTPGRRCWISFKGRAQRRNHRRAEAGKTAFRTPPVATTAITTIPRCHLPLCRACLIPTSQRAAG